MSPTDVKVNSVDLLVPVANIDDSKNKLVQETSIAEVKKNVYPQEGISSTNDAAGSKFNGITEQNQETALAYTSNVEDLWMVHDCAIQIVKEPNNASSGVDIPLNDLDASEKLEADMDFSVNDFSEIFYSCFGMDVDIQSLDNVQGSQENGTVLEDTHKQSDHELHIKEIELEKLIYSAAVVDPTCPNTNDDIEEGEISGDFGVIDALSEDVVSLNEKSIEIEHASQAAEDNEKLICNGEDNEPSLIETVNSNNSHMEVEGRASAGQMPDCSLKNHVCDGISEAQNCGFIGPCLETPVDNITQQNASKNPISDSSGEDEDANKKKRKKGPLTKERRAKKKKKERIKRAEKNRKLGIKRLKLPPPILKEKKIVYCRHYLQGRCHEGEKCNFSHDTVPLTKSKPCRHFARNSCLKGDACPFDHELRKYPCTNYTTNGFCSRESDCLFSHEMPAKQSFSITTNVSKPDCTSAQHTVSRKKASKVAKADVTWPLNKIDAYSCSDRNSPHLIAKPVARTAGKAPKGVSFLLNVGMPLGESSGSKQDGSSLKSSDNGNVCETVKILGSAKKLNEMSDSAPPKKPQGINFLSFAQPLSDEPSNKMLSNLLSNCNLEAGKSVIAGEGKLSGLYLDSVATTKDNRLMNQSAAHLVRDRIENDKGAHVITLHNRNFSPFDKIPSLVPKRLGILPSESATAAMSLVKEVHGMSSQLHDSTKIPSFSFSRGHGYQSTGQKKADISRSFTPSYLPNAPSSVQKVVQSTLAFAEKFEPAIKIGSFIQQGRS